MIIWRIAAVICALVWTIVFFAFNAFPPQNVNSDIVTLFRNNILCLSSIATSLALIFFPMQFYLYAIMCWLWGLVELFDVYNGGTNGMLIYLLGCAFAYKQQFFAKRMPRQFIILLLPLVAIAFKYRLGVDVLVESLMNLFFLAMFFALMYMLLIYPLVKKNKAPPSGSIIIADCNLSKAELDLLDALLREDTYKAMSFDAKISESSVKQRVKILLEKIGADNRGNLLSLYKNGKMILPD